MRYFVWAAVIALCIVCIAMFVPWAWSACAEPGFKTAIVQTGSVNCVEYWAFRYQTLLVGFFTVSVALWTVRRLIEQIQISAAQTDVSVRSLAMQQRANYILTLEAIESLSAWVTDFIVAHADDTDDVMAHDLDAKKRFVSCLSEVRRRGIVTAESIEERQALAILLYCGEAFEDDFDFVEDAEGGIVDVNFIPKTNQQIIGTIAVISESTKDFRKSVERRLSLILK